MQVFLLIPIVNQSEVQNYVVCHCETDVTTNHELEVQHLLPRAPVLHVELYIRLLCPALQLCHLSQVILIWQIGLTEWYNTTHCLASDPIF